MNFSAQTSENSRRSRSASISCGALVRIRARQKRRRFRFVRQQTDGIKVHAPQELLVGRELRRADVQPPQLREHVVVHIVGRDDLRVVRTRRPRGDRGCEPQRPAPWCEPSSLFRRSAAPSPCLSHPHVPCRETSAVLHQFVTSRDAAVGILRRARSCTDLARPVSSFSSGVTVRLTMRTALAGSS